MSNRRKLVPPPQVRRHSKRMHCTDCNSITGRPWCDQYGVWHVTLSHDEWCPVLNGNVSPLGIHLNANTGPKENP